MESNANKQKTQCLTKLDVLTKYKSKRKIIESPLSVFDLIIVKVNSRYAALYLNWNLSTEIHHTMVKELKLIDQTLHIIPSSHSGETLRDDFGFFLFQHESIEQIVTYVELNNELLRHTYLNNLI